MGLGKFINKVVDSEKKKFKENRQREADFQKELKALKWEEEKKQRKKRAREQIKRKYKPRKPGKPMPMMTPSQIYRDIMG